jgi:hypothetical protein
MKTILNWWRYKTTVTKTSKGWRAIVQKRVTWNTIHYVPAKETKKEAIQAAKANIKHIS